MSVGAQFKLKCGSAFLTGCITPMDIDLGPLIHAALDFRIRVFWQPIDSLAGSLPVLFLPSDFSTNKRVDAHVLFCEVGELG